MKEKKNNEFRSSASSSSAAKHDKHAKISRTTSATSRKPVSKTVSAPKKSAVDSNAKKSPAEILRFAEVAVLALVVVSNIYFGFTIKSANAAEGSGAATVSASSSAAPASQLQPASVPKMVGGC